MADPRFKRVLLKISGEGLCKAGSVGLDGEEIHRLAEELKLEGVAQSEWTAEEFADYLDRSAQLRELCAFAVSEEYFQARQALGVTAEATEEE